MNPQDKKHTQQPRTKLEFARLFVGECCSDQAARRWLRSELNANPALLEQLGAIGYKTSTKLLTIKQQQVILEYFHVDFLSKSVH
jgi:hypothetical protein